MSFDVFLIASSASPAGHDLRVATDRALASCGARRGRRGESDIVLASGGDQEFFDADDGEAGGMFALRGLHGEISEMIFAVADATRCFIIFPSNEEPVALRTPSNTGILVGGEDMPVERVVSPRDLGARLAKPFGGWADYADSLDADQDDDEDEDLEIDPSLLDRFFKPSKKD
jgi:hypothetical protein